MAADRGRLAELGELGRQAMLESYTLDVFLDGYRWLYDEVRSRASAPLTLAPVRPSDRVARDLDELRGHSTVYDDLHVEARRVLDRNPEPRNLRDVAVALESMGYTASGAEALGFDSVFDLATAVYELTYLYYVPHVDVAPERRRAPGGSSPTTTWPARGTAFPWIMSVVVLFVGRVALWSSLDATPQVAAMVSLAFFLAAVLAGGCSQMIGRKGTFYLLQKNYPLVRWTVSRFLIYSVAAASLAIALVYTFYIVPYYGLRLGRDVRRVRRGHLRLPAQRGAAVHAPSLLHPGPRHRAGAGGDPGHAPDLFSRQLTRLPPRPAAGSGRRVRGHGGHRRQLPGHADRDPDRETATRWPSSSLPSSGWCCGTRPPTPSTAWPTSS